MSRPTTLVLAFLLAGASIGATEARAAVIKAAGLAPADVQAAVDTAHDGDTVQLPAGTSTWTTGVTMADKGITLRGEGIDKTIVADGTPNGWGASAQKKALTIIGVEGKPWRLSGITFLGRPDGSAATDAGIPQTIRVGGNCKNWRIDHCAVVDSASSIRISGFTYGLIDHCTFRTAVKRGTLVGVWLEGDANTAWNRPLSLGSAEATYVEDCDFDFGDNGGNMVGVHAEGGARGVVRHCLANTVIEFFGTAFGNRGTVSFEIYDNVFGSAAPGGKPTGGIYPLRLCNGTGVVFNNQVHSDTLRSGGLMLDVYRIRGDYTAPWPGHDPIILAQKCDGGSILDGNLPYDATAQGKHTGGNGQSALTCAGANWKPDQWAGFYVWNVTGNSRGRITANTPDSLTAILKPWYVTDSGTHTGDNGQATLTCDGKKWGWSIAHQVVRNLSDGSQGVVNSMTPTTITATLGGGKNNCWNTGDAFEIDVAEPPAGEKEHWDSGDAFKITNGYPCLDQIGRTPGTEVVDGITVQKSEPVYEWNNWLDGKKKLKFSVWKGCEEYIKEGRDFITDTPKPGYQPYRYPHPLQDSAD